jgi:hypothetical protein
MARTLVTGLDYGTKSGRAVLVDVRTREILAHEARITLTACWICPMGLPALGLIGPCMFVYRDTSKKRAVFCVAFI